MADKYPGAGNAVGYWGRCGPYRRVVQDQTAEKVSALLGDKLLTRGKPVRLWLPVNASTPGVVACSCLKNTTTNNERICHECYGFGYTPGFTLFLTETLHFGTTEGESAFTLVNCAVNKQFKPHTIWLNAAATSGTITTTDKPYDNTAEDDWEVRVDAYLRDGANNSVTAEFSTDSGATWFNVTTINGVNKPVGVGTLRLRITMTRTATTNLSPVFQIARVRHVRSDDYNQFILQQRPDVVPGQVLVLRPWVKEQSGTEQSRGSTIDWLNEASWTMPLSWFDTSVAINTPAAKVDDVEPGPHPFYEYATGIKTGERIVITAVSWNEEFGVFTHQNFDQERRAQEFEPPYELVF